MSRRDLVADTREEGFQKRLEHDVRMDAVNKWNVNHEEGTIMMQIAVAKQETFYTYRFESSEVGNAGNAWDVYVEGKSRNILLRVWDTGT